MPECRSSYFEACAIALCTRGVLARLGGATGILSPGSPRKLTSLEESNKHVGDVWVKLAAGPLPYLDNGLFSR
jgi:hypothetical protein